MQVSLELAYTEDEIYELSLAREPRDSLSVSFSCFVANIENIYYELFTATVFAYQTITTRLMAVSWTNKSHAKYFNSQYRW